jgi:glycosyltransferase involved in cell wall biosynthesis
MNTGGHVRTGGIARALSQLGHDVLIYSLAGRQADYRARGADGRRASENIEKIAAGLTEETNLGLGFGLVQAVGRRLDLPRYVQYRLLRLGWIPERLRLALRHADIVMSDMPWCPRIPGPWSNKPWLLISHNLEHELLEQGPPRHRRFARWMRRVEQAAPGTYTDILTCADGDRNFFRTRDMGSGEPRLLPLVRCGVDPGAYAVPPGTRERVRAELQVSDAERLVIFSGSGFGPNVEALAALRAFCSSNQEFLTRERLRLLVVGSVAPEPFQEGALMAAGRVPEIAPYFAAADAGLNPITRGSGANVKLFEYLAARLPVLSTAFGVRGTQLQPDVDFIQFDWPGLQAALASFARDRTPAQWRQFAEEVWLRHRGTCDIGELVKSAIEQLPAFGAYNAGAANPGPALPDTSSSTPKVSA